MHVVCITHVMVGVELVDDIGPVVVVVVDAVVAEAVVVAQHPACGAYTRRQSHRACMIIRIRIIKAQTLNNLKYRNMDMNTPSKCI